MPPPPNVTIQRFDPQADTAVSGEDLLRHSLASGLMPPPPNVTIQRFDPQADTAVSGEDLLRHSL